jgi:hypothetical protein
MDKLYYFKESSLRVAEDISKIAWKASDNAV